MFCIFCNIFRNALNSIGISGAKFPGIQYRTGSVVIGKLKRWIQQLPKVIASYEARCVLRVRPVRVNVAPRALCEEWRIAKNGLKETFIGYADVMKEACELWVGPYRIQDMIDSLG